METIEGVLEEMRDRQRVRNLHYGVDGFVSLNATKDYVDIIGDFADRIEAAHAALLKKIQQLEDENAKLRAALQPVLDIVMDSATSDLSMELAITETQRIYNEGKEEAI